jgi:hypothetical protein
VSFDRRLDQACTHQVVDEFLVVSDDRKIVRPIRPISSAQSVVVRVNGLVDVPSYGSLIGGSVLGLKEGPFTVTTGVNDVLSIQVNDDSPQTVTVPAFARGEPRRIVAALNERFAGLTFYTERGRIGIRTNELGRAASFFVRSSSTFATVIGVKTNRSHRGKDAFPGWTIVSDPNTLADRPLRLICFDEPLQSSGNFVELSYVTMREECRRCGGSGYENDWRYLADGNLAEVRDEDLLIQELTKTIYTMRGSNPFHGWYGSTILDQIGRKISASGIVQNAITSDIYAGFSRWQSIKKQQEEAVGQTVTDPEFPFRLLGVKLDQSQQDPTVMFVTVDVQNRSFRPVQLSRALRIAGSLNLLTP